MADRVFSYVFRGDFGNLKAGLTAAQKNVSDLSGKMTALDKDGARMRAGLSQIGDTAGKVGLAAAAGLGAVVLTAANFDKSMSAVSAVTGETAENMDKLREAAIKAGADTAFSATEAAAGIENLAKAGVSTSDILGGGLAGALDLAAAGEIGVAEAAEAASKAMTQFGLAGADVPHIADLLAAAAGKATGDVSDFTQALNQSGLVADQVGLSIEETTGGLAAFASAGLLGSDAGTSFKTMLGALTPNSKDAAKQMEALGLNAYDAQGNFIGLAEFAGQLQGALGGLTDQQRQAAMETIFGSDAVRAASVLYEQGEQGIRDWTAAVDDSGYAAEVAGKRLDNLAGDWEEFTGSLETALIGAGEGSQGILRELVQGATDAVNAFNGLPSSAQNTATALLAITAVTGSSVWFGSKVITGVANTKAALADLGWTAGGTNGKLKSLAARGGGLVLMTAALVGAAEAIERLNGGFDAGRLERDFEALAGGEVTANMDDLVASLETLRKAGSVPMLADLGGELVTLFGALGNTNVDQAAQDIRALDEYLAGLVESGNAELAAAQFDALVEGLAAAMNTEPERVLGDVNDMLEQYGIALRNAGDRGGFFGETLDVIREALSGVQQATGEAGSAAAGMGNQMAASADDIKRVRGALKDAREAMQEAREESLDIAETFVNLGESLNDSEVSLGEWISELERNAQALRDFQRNAETAGKKGLDEGLVLSLQKAGEDGALRMRELANASEDEIARANRAWWKGQGAIQDFVGEVEGVKPKYVTKLEAQIDQALAEIARLKRELDIPDETVNVWVTRRVVNGSPGMGAVDEFAPRRAKGGPVYGPGTPTSDSIPAWLSTGEFVMKAAAVQKYGLGTMHAMNAMRLAGGGSADGGKAPKYSLDERGEILGLRASIRDLIKALNKDGKDALKGLDRKIALNDLAQARQDLRLALNAPDREARKEEREARKEARELAKEQRRAWRDARQGLDLEGGMSAADIKDEYQEFKRVLREAGIELPKNFDRLRERSLKTAERFEKVSARLEETEDALAEWRATAESVAASVRSIFNNDIYRAGGLANAMLQLEADRNDTAERNSLLQSVGSIFGALGLDTSSAAFQSLATGADMQTLRDLDTAQEIADFVALFESRNQAQVDAGNYAANAVTGAQIEALEATQVQLKSTLDTLTKQLERQEQRLEQAATTGTREGARAGVADGMRDEARTKAAKAKTR